MPNLLDRPYQGNFQPNARAVVKHTPDALLYINGDIAIPGCHRCNGRIDIQRFTKSISIEAGTNPGAHSGSANLVVPQIYGEQIFREGRALLKPALEVHVYMRGYFPVRGQFAHLESSETEGLNGTNLGRYATYPYYHVFHGVITQVNYSYSDGFYDATLTFASMLHFWQYHNMSMNGAALASKPDNSQVQPNLWGNIYNNMHPYAIIYDLYRSTVGAAGGIEKTLNEKTNVQAVVPDSNGLQVYSALQMYWEERFRTTMQNLRMYGVNGRLFNSVQQAYLGRRNSTKINRLLKHVQYLDLDGLSNQKDPFSGNFGTAKSIGLVGGGLDLVFSPRMRPGASGGQEDPLTMNITSMFAFTQNIGSANLPLFEGTYQTKLDVANQVTQAAGFEFYQDVDGDLVFKPPFYNLDTRNSRIYRIEDIDLISAAFSEKEPQATYCVVKAGALVGVHTGGTEGWVGARGTYIDWRLVAKFGWRPANMEVSYFNNPKSLFFLAQSRLDILNIDINTVSVTIPLRPELRPGFPVYIAFVDCFYYITQMSHSFTFGANCTTSLTLTARRAKFFAPGLPGPVKAGENAIERITLNEPFNPERPLEVYENGFPRWAGFPNVVMALDPLRPNPKSFMLKSGLEDLTTRTLGKDDVTLLFNIIREQVKNTGEGAGIFALAEGSSSDERTSPTENTEYVLKQSDDPAGNLVFSLNDLLRDFKTFDAARQQILSSKKEIATQQNNLRRAGRGSIGGGDVGGQAGSQNAGAIQLKIQAAFTNLQAAQQSINPDGGGQENVLVLLIQALQSNDVVRRSLDGMPDAPPTAAWLDILSDVKQNFSGGQSLPGYYRYYSASHPDPDMQGQASLTFDEGSGDDLFASQEVTLSTPATAGGAELPPPVASDKLSKRFGNPDAQFLTKDHRVVLAPNRQNPDRAFFDGSVGGKEGRAEFESVAATAKEMGVPEQYINYTRVQAQRESGFATGIVNKRGAAGSAFRGQKKKYGQDFFEGNPGTRDQWSMGACGWFQQFPARVVSAFKDSPCFKNSPYIVFDPEFQYAANLVGMRAARGRLLPAGVHDLDPDEQTFNRIARSQGNVWAINPDSTSPRHATNIPGRTSREQATKLAASSDARLRINGRRTGLTDEEIEQQFFTDVVPPNSSWSYPPGNVDSKGRPAFDPCQFALDMKKRRGKTVSEQQLEAPPAEPPTPAVIQGDNARISLTANELESSVPVQGFIQGPLTKPDGVTRAPEAEIGDVFPKRGIKVVAARSGQTEVVDTSQIQALTFTRSEAMKAVAVQGLANEQGLYEPNELAVFLTKNLIVRLTAETQPLLVGAESTPNTFVREVYEQIAEDLEEGEGNDPAMDPSATTYPVYTRIGNQDAPAEGRFLVQEWASVQLPAFADAATTNEVFSLPDVTPGVGITGAISLSNNRSAADLTLAELGKVPPFQASDLDGIVQKVLAAYSKTIVDTVVTAYTGARARAGYVQGKRPYGFTDRMTALTDSFNSIALAVTGVQFDISKQRSATRAERAAKKNKGIFTPVFPVSDGAGYEVIGSFRYGRGLTVDPGGTFDSINNSPDPFSGVDAATAEAFLRAMTSIQSLTPNANSKDKREAFLATQIGLLKAQQAEIEDTILGDVTGLNPHQRDSLFDQNIRRIAQVRLALQQVQAANPDAVSELAEANNLDADTLLLPNANPNQFETKFGNFPANQLREGVLKTTVTNAAFNLSDLEPHLQQKIHSTCACAGANSHILLQAFARNDFMAIAGIDPDDDPATASVSEQILLQLPEYLSQRQALTGQQLDVEGPDLADAFSKIKDIRNTFSGTGEQLRDAGRQFRETGAQFRDIDINLGGN